MQKSAVNSSIIRHAIFEAEGFIKNYVEYNLEVGMAACQSGGFMVMEAGVFYKPLQYLKIGIMKGHVLRGFEMYEGCVNVLSSEKPIYALKFSPCHPIGGVIETDYSFNETMGIHAQLAVMDGTGGTLEDEHDINLGLYFRTPMRGLTVAGFYSDIQWNNLYTRVDTIIISGRHVPRGMDPPQEVAFIQEKAIYNGYRTGLGYSYDQRNTHIRGEFYTGKAFKDLLDFEYYRNIWADSSNDAKIRNAPFEEMKMNAFFMEGGYKIKTGAEQLPYVQPYIHYQWWDQAAHLDGDYIHSLLTFGANFGLADKHTRLRVEYQATLTFANDGAFPNYSEGQQANRFMVRIQAGL
jgi:hypothetical protein